MSKVFFQLDGGIGNIILVTPALKSLHESGYTIDIFVRGDFDGIRDLFSHASYVSNVFTNVNGIKTFDYQYYIASFLSKFPLEGFDFSKTILIHAFYSAFYNYSIPESKMYLNIATLINPNCSQSLETKIEIRNELENKFQDVDKETLILAPGCKKEFPIKRWFEFDSLAKKFKKVIVVGTKDDEDLSYSYRFSRISLKYIKKIIIKNKSYFIKKILGAPHGRVQKWPEHVKDYTGKLTLEETGQIIKKAGFFVGNDSGITHLSSALGTPTLFIFGPSSITKNFPHENTNSTYISLNLDCQPCQYGGKYSNAWTKNYVGCPIKVKCLESLTVDDVVTKINENWIGQVK